MIPKRIKIGPITYKIVEVAELKDNDDKPMFGMVKTSTQTIFIEKNLAPEEKLQTFLHEVLHVIMAQMGMFDHNEGMIDGIAYGLLGVFKNNKALCPPMMQKPSDIGR